jgi:hypothetical protein
MSSPCSPVEVEEAQAPFHLDGHTVVLSVVLVGLVRALLPIIPVQPTPVGITAVSLLYLGLLVSVGAALGALAAPRGGRALLVAVPFVAVAVAVRVVGPTLPPGLWVGLVRALGDWAVFCAAVLVGSAASGIVREPNLLPPIALTAAVVDYVAIRFGGPTVHLLASNPALVEGASTALPAIGAAAVPIAGGHAMGLATGGALAIVGTGDLLFLGLAFGAVGRFGFRFGPSAVWTVVGAIVGMATALVGNLPLPGLPFLALGCIAPNVGRFRYSRGELLSLGVVALFLIAFCVGLVVVFGGKPPEGAGALP